MTFQGTRSLLKRHASRPAVGFALAFCVGLIPCQSPPFIPGELNWARFAGALIAAGAAVFEMRRRRTAGGIDLRRRTFLLWRAFASGAGPFFLIYVLFVVHVSTAEGSAAVPVGVGASCCGRLPGKDCIRQKLNLDAGAIRRCWGEYSVAAVHLGLVSTYWWTAGTGGALIGLFLLRLPPEEETQQPEASGWDYDLFVSYAHEDKSFVQALVEDLSGQGYRLWWDGTIGAGDVFVRQINEEFKESRQFAVVLSPESCASPWVDLEISTAIAIDVQRRRQGEEARAPFVIPILYRDCEIPSLLMPRTFVDFTRSYEQGLDELLRVLGPPQSQVG